MQLLVVGPLEAGALAWVMSGGEEVVTVACKLAFQLAPGACLLASPEPLADADALALAGRAPSAADLGRPSDLDPFKPRADVLLVGHAFAPRGAPVRSLVARLALGGPGGVDKRVEVHGDRLQHPGNAIEARTFVRMPLSWARAPGGAGTRNPLGVLLDPPSASDAPRTLPNLMPIPRGEGAACFAPVPPSFPSRASRLRVPPERLAGWRSRPMPAELDPAFFNAAPEDQQPAQLAPDAPLVLENLHPEHATLSTRLPGLSPQLFVEPRAAAPEEIPLRADTLLLDTDRGLGTLTFRAVLRRPPPGARLVAALDERGRRLSLVEALGRAAGGGRALTVEVSEGPGFEPPNGSLRGVVVTLAPAGLAEGPRMTAPAGAGPSAPALPFQPFPPPDADAGQREETFCPAPSAAPPVETRTETRTEPARKGLAVELLWASAAPDLGARLEAFPGSGARAEAGRADGGARARVHEVLALAPPSSFEELEEAMAGAVRPDGRFVPPLVVVEGKLSPDLEPIAVLRAAIAIARAEPDARGGSLAELVELASAWASAPEAASAKSAARAMLTRLSEGFGATTRLPAGYLEGEAHRAALEGGAFARRTALGASCLRVRLALATGSPEESVMAYLPAEAKGTLPRFEALRVRVLGELGAPLEQDATPFFALRVHGLGRLVG